LTPRASGGYNLSVTSANGEQGEKEAATAAALFLTGEEGQRLLGEVADLPGDAAARVL